MSHEALDAVRRELSALPPPVVVFNKSHSGSRLVARLLQEAGTFMGAGLNESMDAVALLALVERAVEAFYPDYSDLWHRPGADAELALLARHGFTELLKGRGERPWGWKLCETVYALPLIDFLFPEARYIHVVRDGRDVAFSDHVPPKKPFWQKVYVDAVGVRFWRGLFFGRYARTGYRIDSSRYNVQHWANSVTLGRHYGAMLRDRYLEVRYEALCRDFDREGRRLLAFAGAPSAERALDVLRSTVSTASTGKFRRESSWRVGRVVRFARPQLTAFGYID